ncbi:hypothetical protein [Mucilaginibacter sp.]|uniref:diacylglycerol/polyprenol kinase family protein n=1 Tax=Mucilaginibacter sp. TaxID=1882438 RepID=UPI00261E5C15|nr:hypothetical protein [Mucilaginibacter sp.]MDB4920042.1 phosphatidate cytidylyltransferase [Mucilaginibacter sp.]
MLKKILVDIKNKAISDDLSIKSELLRKSVHFIAYFNIILIYPLLDKSGLLMLLVPTSLMLILFELQRVRSRTFDNFVKMNFKFLLRSEELKTSMSKMQIISSTWACWSFTVISILFPLHIAVSCFAMFLIADAMAALVGKWIGKNHWIKSKKTIEGSVAFLCTGLIVMLLFPGVVFKAGAIAVLVATMAEIPKRPLDDNFRVPLIGAIALFLFEKLFV